MKSFKRSQRVADQIKRDASEVIAEMLRDDTRLMVTVSAVNITDDLRNAKIFYTVLGDTEERELAKAFFKRALRAIQAELAKRIRIRRFPEITIHYDESLLEGLRLTALIEKVVLAKDKNIDDSDEEI